MGYNRPNTYSITTGFANSNPVDATDYAFGAFTHNALSSWASRNASKMIAPRAGHIRAMTLFTFAGTATGTSEDIVLKIRIDDTTDYTVATVGVATAARDFENYSLNIPVSEGSEIVCWFDNPTWVTNPEGFRGFGCILIEGE